MGKKRETERKLCNWIVSTFYAPTEKSHPKEREQENDEAKNDVYKNILVTNYSTPIAVYTVCDEERWRVRQVGNHWLHGFCWSFVSPPSLSIAQHIVNITLYLFCLSKCFATLKTGECAASVFLLSLSSAHQLCTDQKHTQRSTRAFVYRKYRFPS